MTNKEIVLGVMKEHPCITCAQVHNYALRMFNENITPQAASSVLRGYAQQGLAAQSRHPMTGKMVYWLTDTGKEKLQ